MGRMFNALLLLALLSGFAAAADAPIVSIIDPPSGASLREGDTIMVKAEATDPDGPVAKMELYEGDVLLGETNAAAARLWWTPSSIGMHELTAVAEDASGLRSTSAVVQVSVSSPIERSLSWSPRNADDIEWNGYALNWRVGVGGPYSVFRADDAVSIGGGPAPVFIGSNGEPGHVSPASVTLGGGKVVTGGDILTGSMTVSGAIFSNYSGSLSFTGGTFVSSFNAVTYELSAAPDGASMHFGTGPIHLPGTTFGFQPGVGRTATLENDFVLSGSSCSIIANPLNRSNTVVHFTGTLSLSRAIHFVLYSGNHQFAGGLSDNSPHEWAGPVILDHTAPQGPEIRVTGNYGSKGIVISGRIYDGEGSGTNRLAFVNYGAPFIRLAGANTYSRGTLIMSSPSAPKGRVEVASNSTFGSGDVEVAGVIRLMGSRNVASNASLAVGIGGQVILDPGVKLRINSLRLGGTTYTSGLFTQTNAPGYLFSNGTIRLPATNRQPTITLTAPADGTIYANGGPVPLQAQVADEDSYIDRVDFFLGGAFIGRSTNAPYSLMLSNPPPGRHHVNAVVYDDEGKSASTPRAMIIVAPRIAAVRLEGNTNAVITFMRPANSPVDVLAASSMPTSDWTNVASLPPSGGTNVVQVTNAVPENAPARFFRLRIP